MPEVIDNNKVGLLIKQLLKDYHMTQEDLARELSISKSAVSQNLNGKSSFDIQNLVAISKLFEISLEQLLIKQSENNKEIASEYEKLVKRGIDGFAKLDIKNMQIASPDMYGNVLIEYVIAYDDVELFKLLHMADITFLDDTYHKARLIYTKLIWYALKHRIDEVLKYLNAFVRLFGSIAFFEEDYRKEIWSFLNQETYQVLVAKIASESVAKKVKWLFGIEITKRYHYLSKREWMEHIALYQLNRVFQTIYSKFDFVNDYSILVRICLKYDYDDGIIWYINQISENHPSFEVVVSEAQEIIFELAKLKKHEAFARALDKHLYTNINKLMSRLIMGGLIDSYMYCLDHYSPLLDFQVVGQAAVMSGNLILLEHIVNRLKQNDLNYLLSLVNEKHLSILEFLVKKGAKFEVGYYNAGTMNKINKFISELLERNQ